MYQSPFGVVAAAPPKSFCAYFCHSLACWVEFPSLPLFNSDEWVIVHPLIMQDMYVYKLTNYFQMNFVKNTHIN